MDPKRRAGGSAAEAGHTFFLAAIAVVLFAALAYTVVYADRGTGWREERTMLSAAQITQFPAALRTTVVRMVTGGVAVEDLSFASAGEGRNLVFSTMGGNAFLQDPPSEAGSASRWRFKTAPVDEGGTRGWYVAGIGTDGRSGKDVFAFLDGLDLAVCRQILQSLGLEDTPLTESVPVDFSGADEGLPSQQGGAGGSRTAATAAAGSVFKAWDEAGSAQFYACVRNGADGSYVYYHVLYDR